MFDENEEEVARINRMHEERHQLPPPSIGQMLSTVVFVAMILVLVTGCQLGQSVMVSKGETGGVSELLRGEIEYCKITSTPEIELSEQDRAAFRKYCTEARQ